MQKRFYIAYGSNLNIDQMRFRCPDATIVGTAKLSGWELLFRGSRTGYYLTIERRQGFIVPVGVWAVSEEDEQSLDRYEGYPGFYYKHEMLVHVRCIKTGKTNLLHGFAYIMHEDRPIGIPSPYYIRTCAEGYRNFKFDLTVLAEAYHRSKERAGI